MTLLKKTYKSLFVVTSLMMSAQTISSPTIIPSAPTMAAKAYVLMDYRSGKIIAQDNAEERLHPASLTKMMTSYVVGKEIAQGNIKETDMVTVSEKAWGKNFPDSSKMFIEVGKQVSVADLNRGIIVQSGNDACVAIAEHIAGTESGFADLMNTWAEQLGMFDSHFVNSHGLDSVDHYTTASDMAVLARALIRDVPEEYRIYSEKSFTYNGITQHNRNGLLWDKSMNVDGIKTGHTSKAGYSLVSSATKGDMRLIAVVMGTKSTAARKSESKKLLNFGFRFYESATPYKAGDSLVEQPVWFGDKKQIKLGLLEDTNLVVYRGQARKLNADFEINQELEAPIAKGDVIGTVFFNVDGEEVAQYPLVALEEVQPGSLFSRIVDYFKKLFADLLN
ncbi:D-alanyl-D-alanine carboxypeptidase family protein [Paraferrimonas sp. SM1919]|uniref:D-alanyl-D-alanine carboxypeptidase family protein n=1 Tax=Paraferrimonas sp. SM1919 TaxID=2662263 RepID=UPI0013D47DAC|nr:D-alanyl-D-alanine carboxypeptidase family protein [Paraferrimonas sp. SM1919]